MKLVRVVAPHFVAGFESDDAGGGRLLLHGLRLTTGAAGNIASEIADEDLSMFASELLTGIELDLLQYIY